MMHATQIWLAAWEHASALPRGLREAELLRHAGADEGGDGDLALAELPLGERDRLLLELRERLFGTELQCVADCPVCGETCEWGCSISALRADLPTEPFRREYTWQGDGLDVVYRLPNSSDLALVASLEDPSRARSLLLERCVLATGGTGGPIPAAALTQEVQSAIAGAMAEVDPQAACAVELQCPACTESWEADFDIGAFAWAELEAWAQRTFEDVHAIACRYGWSEGEILALTPARRARYLALVNV